MRKTASPQQPNPPAVHEKRRDRSLEGLDEPPTPASECGQHRSMENESNVYVGRAAERPAIDCRPHAHRGSRPQPERLLSVSPGHLTQRHADLAAAAKARTRTVQPD